MEKLSSSLSSARDTGLKVTLSANPPYSYNTAIALQDAGILGRYICGVGLNQLPEMLGRVLPNYWVMKLKGRQISCIDPERLKTIWLPELLQKGLPMMGLISGERGNWIASHLFDLAASRYVMDCDILHVLSGVGLYSARRAKRRGAIVICDQNTAYPDYERQLIRAEYEKLGLTFDPPGLLLNSKVKATYELADYIVVPSEFAKRSFLQADYDPERIFVVPYGTNVQPDGSPTADGGSVFRIICAAQIVPRKGIHYLVQAFEELGLPDAELVLVGAVREEMRDFVEGWVNRNPRITVTGSVPLVQLNEHYGRSSVFVLPSVSEGSALVMYGAMGAGLPLIVTENTGSGELVREGEEGFVVPIRDVETLKERILWLYENPGLRREMGMAARERVREFSWEKYGERLISVYEEVARREGIPA